MDRREKKTKGAIKKALMKILNYNSLHSLSVIDLCHEADIARSTFYLHYSNIDQVLDEIETDRYNEIIQICLIYLNTGVKNTCLKIAEYVKQEKESYRTLLLKTEMHFQNKIKILFHENNVFSYDKKLNDPVLGKYYFSFIMNGAIGVFSEWILNDCSIDEKILIDGFINQLFDENKFLI